MKILLATQTRGGLDDFISPVFGRASTFTIVEVKDGKVEKVEVVKNQAAAAFSGAGIQAAQFAVNKNVDMVVAGSFGPNASMVLAQSGVIFTAGYAGFKVEDAIKILIKEGRMRLSVEQEKRVLEARKRYIEDQLRWIKERLRQFEEKNEKQNK